MAQTQLGETEGIRNLGLERRVVEPLRPLGCTLRDPERVPVVSRVVEDRSTTKLCAYPLDLTNDARITRRLDLRMEIARVCANFEVGQARERAACMRHQLRVAHERVHKGDETPSPIFQACPLLHRQLGPLHGPTASLLPQDHPAGRVVLQGRGDGGPCLGGRRRPTLPQSRGECRSKRRIPMRPDRCTQPLACVSWRRVPVEHKGQPTQRTSEA